MRWAFAGSAACCFVVPALVTMLPARLSEDGSDDAVDRELDALAR